MPNARPSAALLKTLRRTAFVDLMRHPSAQRPSVFLLRDRTGAVVGTVSATMSSTPALSPESLCSSIAEVCGHEPYPGRDIDATADECAYLLSTDVWAEVDQASIARYANRYLATYADGRRTYVFRRFGGNASTIVA